MQQTPYFNLDRMRVDMAAKGWQPKDLALQAGVSGATVSRFFDGIHQTNRTAKKLATALGFSVRRYLEPALPFERRKDVRHA